MELPFPVSRETLTRLERYRDVLLEWNTRINLIGPSTEKDSLVRHFADSGQILPLLPGGKAVLADLGSGGGFPGLVLAILNPALEVHLIESDRRKSAFLQEVARVIECNARIHSKRIASITSLKADVVTARALAPLPLLLEMAFPFLHSNSFCLFPKGENYIKELDEVRGWSYELQVHPSQTQPGAVILRFSQLQRDI